MALFSLLLALLIERTVALSNHWQFQHWFDLAVSQTRQFLEPTSATFQIVLVAMPTLLTYGLLNLIEGVLFGVLSLICWTVIALICIGCIHYRDLYKRYLLSVCKEDTQGSYHLAAQLSDVDQMSVDNETMLGTRVGRQLSWINYRFYCSIVFMMIIGGPVAVVFYASLRTLDLMVFKQQLPKMNLVKELLFIIDWLPARLIALAYVLVGNFSNAISVWISLTLNWKAPAYDVVSKVAMASEQMSKSQGEEGVCMQSTCRLVSLAKRTLLLLVVAMSVLTIFGFLI
jgi:AmpE protein